MPTSDVPPSGGKGGDNAPAAAAAAAGSGWQHTAAAVLSPAQAPESGDASAAAGQQVLSPAQAPEAGDANAASALQGMDRQQFQAYFLWPQACLAEHGGWMESTGHGRWLSDGTNHWYAEPWERVVVYQ